MSCFPSSFISLPCSFTFDGEIIRRITFPLGGVHKTLPAHPLSLCRRVDASLSARPHPPPQSLYSHQFHSKGTSCRLLREYPELMPSIYLPSKFYLTALFLLTSFVASKKLTHMFMANDAVVLITVHERDRINDREGKNISAGKQVNKF